MRASGWYAISLSILFGCGQGRPPGNNSERYTIVEIPSHKGMSSVWARGVNSRGDVVGQVLIGPDAERAKSEAFLYDGETRTPRRIGDTGTWRQYATAINDVRQVAVNDFDTGHAFLWDADAMRDVDTVEGYSGRVFTELIAINAHGWLVGSSVTAKGQHAVLWDGTRLRDLTPALQGLSFAYALNSVGQVVGSLSPPGTGQQRAVLFENGEMRDLGTLGGDSTAVGINDSGRIVGQSGDHGFVYDLPNGPMRDIAPGQFTGLSGVNAAGDAVGGMGGRAILWRDGKFIDLTNALGDPAWLLIGATAISDQGQIIGSGTHSGNRREFLLSPQ